MNKKIVVENTLTDVRSYFKDKGYDVRTMYKNSTLDDITTNDYEAIILEKDTLGELKTSSPIIEASGLSAEDIYKKLNNIK
ncbi:MAG: hypothetical protein FH751_05215 [Firmicutes bacterium]|nr:hypothetical protein [Bacillota bacterium]